MRQFSFWECIARISNMQSQFIDSLIGHPSEFEFITLSNLDVRLSRLGFSFLVVVVVHCASSSLRYDSLAEASFRSWRPSVSGCIICFRAIKNKSTPKRNRTTARPCAPPFGTTSK